MNQLDGVIDVDLPAKAGDLDVDDVVERNGVGGLLPDVPGERGARDDLPLVAEQELEQLELAGRQVHRAPAARDAPLHQIQLEIRVAQTHWIGRTPAAAQRADPGEELGEGEGL